MIKKNLIILTFLYLIASISSQAQAETAQLKNPDALEMINLIGIQSPNELHDVVLIAYVSEHMQPQFIYRAIIDGRLSNSVSATQENLEKWFQLAKTSKFQVQHHSAGSHSERVRMQVLCNLEQQYCDLEDKYFNTFDDQNTTSININKLMKIGSANCSNDCVFRAFSGCLPGEIEHSCIESGHHGVKGCFCCSGK